MIRRAEKSVQYGGFWKLGDGSEREKDRIRTSTVTVTLVNGCFVAQGDEVQGGALLTIPSGSMYPTVVENYNDHSSY